MSGLDRTDSHLALAHRFTETSHAVEDALLVTAIACNAVGEMELDVPCRTPNAMGVGCADCGQDTSTDAVDSTHLYLDLLERAVRNSLYLPEQSGSFGPEMVSLAGHTRERLISKYGDDFNARLFTARRICSMWSAYSAPAHTLGSSAAVANVRFCAEQALKEETPGDFIETGAFRGGQTIMMRGVLKAHQIHDRRVFVADSFAGLPEPDSTTCVADAIAFDLLDPARALRAKAAEVRDNFSRYGLLDDHVVLLEGWFEDTLTDPRLDRLAVIRLDGDYYSSTAIALEHLYPRLSIGGFLIVDDYGLPVGCRQAVDAYRAANNIADPIERVDLQTVYWKRTA